jgi:hypothetical protein
VPPGGAVGHPARGRVDRRGSLSLVPTDHEDPDVRPSPAIPSFASLRGPQRRSQVDVLVPEEQAPPRPPEWADLWLLGRHVAREVVALQVRLLRRLLGG